MRENENLGKGEGRMRVSEAADCSRLVCVCERVLCVLSVCVCVCVFVEGAVSIRPADTRTCVIPPR